MTPDISVIVPTHNSAVRNAGAGLRHRVMLLQAEVRCWLR